MKAPRFAITLFLLPTFLLAEEWNQWRGPNRDGTIAKQDWPANFDGLKQAWRVDLAEGYSSPVAANGNVYTVETHDKKSEIVRSFDLETGEATWNQEWEGAMKVPFFAAKNGSWARSTPATDGESIYVGGIRDVLVKLNAASGEEEWRVDFMEREGTELPAFGFVCSPLRDGEFVYLQAGCAVTKLNVETGETVWRAMEDRRAMFGSAFSSPVIATIHGKRQLVAQTRSTLGGMDLETGEVLWSTPVMAFRGMNILTPLAIGNRIFTATYGGGSSLIAIEKTGEKLQTKVVWNDEKLEGYMASPVVVGDYVYLLTRDQHFHCIELATGKVKWKSDEKFGQYWSMIVNDGEILALDQKGELLLINASPEKLDIVARKKVSKQPTWAHLGVHENRLLVRELRGLSVYDWN